jgi:hypothetical protein
MSQQNEQPDVGLTNEPPEVASEDVKPTTVVAPKRHGGGPKTTAGKARASRNALRDGFFAKHFLDDPFFREDKREFLRVRRELIKEWAPAGASDLFQVEIAAWSMVNYGRLIEHVQALVLGQNTPQVPNLDYLITLEMARMEEEQKPRAEHIPDEDAKVPLEEEVERRIRAKYGKQFAQAEELARKLEYIQRIKKSIPSEAVYEWSQRVGKHIIDNLYRALRELERSRCRTAGANVPPALCVELLHD